jgi:hypothetical protein
MIRVISPESPLQVRPVAIFIFRVSLRSEPVALLGLPGLRIDMEMAAERPSIVNCAGH